MSLGSFRQRPIKRRWPIGITTAAMIAFVVFFVASASGTLNGSPSLFESNDGNMTVEGTNVADWNCFAGHSIGFQAAAGINKGTGTCSSSLVYANAHVLPDAGVEWTPGQKQDTPCPTTQTGSSPGKDTFTDVASYNETASSGNVFLYGGTIRATANGNASENIELQQSKTACPNSTINQRTSGDRLLAFDYLNGGTSVDLHILTWITSLTDTSGGNNIAPVSGCNVSKDNPPCWGAAVIHPNVTTFEGKANATAISAGPPSDNGINGAALVANQFAEFGVNLTTALGLSPTACSPFANIVWESRSSGSSFSSNPEDVLAEQQSLSNCGEIKIIKHTDPAGQSKDFSFTSNIPGSGNNSFTLNDGATTTNTRDMTGVVHGSYTVTEGANPSGYTFESLTCTVVGSGTTVPASGTTTTSSEIATINLAPGDVITCTYINQQNTATFSTLVSNAGTVTPGASVHDTATVSGNQSVTPLGTVTFSLCGPLPSATGCSSGGASAGSGTLAATKVAGQASADSSAVNTLTHPLTAGFYCFEATWPGDPTNYPGSRDSTTATNECFQVLKIDTQTVTTPNDGSGVTKNTITLGSTIYDTAVVSGTAVGGDPGGSVVFHVCSGSCTSNGTLVGDSNGVALTGNGDNTSSATSAAFKPSATGSYCFRGDYSGSPIYNTSSDSGANECFTVTDKTTSTSAQTWYPNDSASVTANHGATLTGTLTIQLYTGDNCGKTSGSATSQSYSSGDQKTGQATITVNSGTQTTYGVTDPSTSFSWLVTFASDDTNVSGSSHCESSSLTITN
jgi:hypothetical protein